MESCGAELAKDAVVPEQLAELMAHVAENLEAHARWVGTATPAAEQEHLWLWKVAEDYRGIASAARRAAASMRSMGSLPIAPHDPAQLDRAAFGRWMRQKIELQRAFAGLLLEHAAASEQVLADGFASA